MANRKEKPLDVEEHKRRSDYKMLKPTERDWDGWELTGSMKWVRLDILGELWDPDHRPAIMLPKQERPQAVGRGGSRKGVAWPRDFSARINAVLRIVYRWRDHGYAKLYQPPFYGQPQWISLTEAGLAERRLPWHEVDWPDPSDLRHDDRYYISHIHRLNQVHMRLLAGAAHVPRHEWVSERAIDARLPPRELGIMRPHLADGELMLQEDGTWPIKVDDQIVDEVQMKRGQKIAVEVELSRKDYPRLDERVLPSLLEHYDYVWYFAEPAARQAVSTARGEHLQSEEDRRRIRIMNLSEYL